MKHVCIQDLEQMPRAVTAPAPVLSRQGPCRCCTRAPPRPTTASHQLLQTQVPNTGSVLSSSESKLRSSSIPHQPTSKNQTLSTFEKSQKIQKPKSPCPPGQQQLSHQFWDLLGTATSPIRPPHSQPTHPQSPAEQPPSQLPGRGDVAQPREGGGGGKGMELCRLIGSVQIQAEEGATRHGPWAQLSTLYT